MAELFPVWQYGIVNIKDFKLSSVFIRSHPRSITIHNGGIRAYWLSGTFSGLSSNIQGVLYFHLVIPNIFVVLGILWVGISRSPTPFLNSAQLRFS